MFNKKCHVNVKDQCYCKFIYGRGRSNHRNCSVKKGVLENFASFTGIQLCWSL